MAKARGCDARRSCPREAWIRSRSGRSWRGRTAARYARQVGIERGGRRARDLADYARDELARIDGVRVLDRGGARAPIVTATVPGLDAEQLVHTLRRRGINTSAAVREHAVIDMDAKAVSSAVRLSPHSYNTRAEVDRAVDAIREFVA